MDDAPADLAAFCEREWPRLCGTLTLYLGDRALGEDLAQEALARVCRDWSRVRTLESPGGWAHRVAMNLATSHLRRDRTTRRAMKHLEPHPGASTGYDAAETLAVRAAVLALPDRQRAVLVLRYFADMSVEAVAAALKVPEGTVKTLTRSAIASLRTAGLVDDGVHLEATDVN